MICLPFYKFDLPCLSVYCYLAAEVLNSEEVVKKNGENLKSVFSVAVSMVPLIFLYITIGVLAPNERGE
jgi:hypothetical protein